MQVTQSQTAPLSKNVHTHQVHTIKPMPISKHGAAHDNRQSQSVKSDDSGCVLRGIYLPWLKPAKLTLSACSFGVPLMCLTLYVHQNDVFLFQVVAMERDRQSRVAAGQPMPAA